MFRMKVSHGTNHCVDCGAPVPGSRRQRCNACQIRRSRGATLPAGATCEHCGEGRRAVLQLVKLGQGRAVLCGNCSMLSRRLSPRPTGPQDALQRLGRRPWSAGQREAYSQRQAVQGGPAVDVGELAAAILLGAD